MTPADDEDRFPVQGCAVLCCVMACALIALVALIWSLGGCWAAFKALI